MLIDGLNDLFFIKMFINILILNNGCEISFDENNKVYDFRSKTLQDIINDTLTKYNVKFVYSTNKICDDRSKTDIKKISFISNELHIILNEILLRISKFEI